MDYKEKYEQALERARKIHNQTEFDYEKGMMEEIFPELEESEDERIKKWIIDDIRYNINNDPLNNSEYKKEAEKAIAWLEKQKTIDVLDKEEREFADNVDSYRKDMDEFYKKGYNAGREAEKHYWLGKQDEQKSADNTEPKFKVGDWAVSNLDGIARQISEVHFDEYNSYYVVDGKSVNLEEYDRLHHLWTIADVKDGDVLYSLDSKQPFIFKHRKPNEQAEVYCGINIYGKFFVWNTKDCIITTDKYIPTTIEQRGLLFQKMKEAGYEWNAEKKELKKIESKKLDADKVFEWFDEYVVPTKFEDVQNYVNQFKEDFEI